MEAVVMGVRDQRVPERVDVELHGPDRSDAPHDPGQRRHSLLVGHDEDDVAMAVDPNARAPDADRVAVRLAPPVAVVERGIELPVPYDRRQTLPRPRHALAAETPMP